MATGPGIVVTDSGPILHLHWVGAAWALPEQKLYVVDSVWREAVAHEPGALLDSRIVRVADPVPISPLLSAWRLHLGEAAALSVGLAERVRAEVLFLCDERVARLACASLELPVTGSLGLILQALRSGRTTAAEARRALSELPLVGRMHLSHRLLLKMRATQGEVRTRLTARGWRTATPLLPRHSAHHSYSEAVGCIASPCWTLLSSPKRAC